MIVLTYVASLRWSHLSLLGNCKLKGLLSKSMLLFCPREVVRQMVLFCSFFLTHTLILLIILLVVCCKLEVLILVIYLFVYLSSLYYIEITPVMCRF